MRNLLLVSSSRLHGHGFLEHCEDAIQSHFEGVNKVLFVPFALADRDGYAELVKNRFGELGLEMDSLHQSADPVAAIQNAEGIFVGGGNSFRLLKTLYDLQLMKPLRKYVGEGKPYMGSSAGTNMACPTIRTTNDMPIVQPPSLDALDLIPFQINPHFLDADPDSTHKGETREQRLAEYLEENDRPVAGIREGSWLRITGNHCKLEGSTGMMLFSKGKAPTPFTSGADLDFLL
jgi:dipeptidase E